MPSFPSKMKRKKKKKEKALNSSEDEWGVPVGKDADDLSVEGGVDESSLHSQSPTSVTKFEHIIMTSKEYEKHYPSDMKSNDGRNVKVEEDMEEHEADNHSTFRKSKNSMMKLKEPPSAKIAAFSGPPRYDWIDIESSAAIKIQAIFRRNRVLKKLEKSGKETARMRNRKRQRRAKKKDAVTDDVPFLFSFCGIGYLFGDASAENEEIRRQRNRAAYEEKRRQRWDYEEKQRKYRWRQQESEEVHEGYEVVDNVTTNY